MFTGIIEALGIVNAVETRGTNKTFWISSPITSELKVDQSLSHNGVCLTVEEIVKDTYRVTAVSETLDKTNLGSLKSNDLVNLERCLPLHGRLDGHMVQGHVDCTAILIEKTDMDGSVIFQFSYPIGFRQLIIEKGSIAVNGISLTAFNTVNNYFSVALIPYTYAHTNLKNMAPNESVNIEFDMIGKYINRFLESKNAG